MQFLKDFDVFSEILEKTYEILQALQYDCIMEFFRKFAMHFAKICAFSVQHTKFFASFRYHFSQNFFLTKKSFENLVWYVYSIFHSASKVFHPRFSLIHAIKAIKNFNLFFIS